MPDALPLRPSVSVQFSATESILAVTKREAGRMIGVSERTIERMIHDGQLAHVKLNRRVIVPVAALQQFLAQRTVMNAPAPLPIEKAVAS